MRRTGGKAGPIAVRTASWATTRWGGHGAAAVAGASAGMPLKNDAASAPTLSELPSGNAAGEITINVPPLTCVGPV